VLWIFVALGAMLAGLIGWGTAKPTWYSRAGFAAGVINGRLEVARSNGALMRQPSSWVIKTPDGFASIMTAPASIWRPTMSNAAFAMGAGPSSASLYRLRVIYVPLWPFAVLAGGAAGLLYWRRKATPLAGHCRCGYDLRGLVAERCPECGRPAGGTAARIAAGLRRWSAPRRQVSAAPIPA
jgi:hypothetical protein